MLAGPRAGSSQAVSRVAAEVDPVIVAPSNIVELSIIWSGGHTAIDNCRQESDAHCQS